MAFFFLTYYLYKYFDALTHTTLYDFCYSRTTNKSIVEIVKGKHMFGVQCEILFHHLLQDSGFRYVFAFIYLFCFVSNPLSLSTLSMYLSPCSPNHTFVFYDLNHFAHLFFLCLLHYHFLLCSKVQARMAFSFYLQRVQMRLLVESRTNTTPAWAQKDSDQMVFVFLLYMIYFEHIFIPHHNSQF